MCRVHPLLLLLLMAVASVSAHGQTLTQLRHQHPTQLVVRGASPAPFETDVPVGATPVHYISHGRSLLAWFAMPMEPTNKPIPAVLYAHQGFALTAQAWEDARPFVHAGFAVLLPAWRGENGNPGEFERYCGEVEDAAEALEYLRAQPGIDKNRVYAAGDTMGGTTVFLLAESGAAIRKAATCSPFPDIADAIRHGLTPQRWLFPYNWQNDSENSLRSPGRHLKDLVCNLSIYNSSSDPLYQRQARALPALARKYGKVIPTREFAGTDQRTVVKPAVDAMIVEFRKDLLAK